MGQTRDSLVQYRRARCRRRQASKRAKRRLGGLAVAARIARNHPRRRALEDVQLRSRRRDARAILDGAAAGADRRDALAGAGRSRAATARSERPCPSKRSMPGQARQMRHVQRSRREHDVTRPQFEPRGQHHAPVRGMRVEMQAGHLLPEADVRAARRSARSCRGCTAGFPASPRSAGSSRACRRTRYEYRCDCTSHSAPGYELSRQVPPTSPPFSRIAKRRSPWRSSWMAMQRPPKPRADDRDFEHLGCSRTEAGSAGSCGVAVMAGATVLRFAASPQS